MIYEGTSLDSRMDFDKGAASQRAGCADGLIKSRRVNWILDANIAAFFDEIERLDAEISEHRIADQRLLRLIRKWLKAGVIEDGRGCGDQGNTQARSRHCWRTSTCTTHWIFGHNNGEADMHGARVSIVRYADDSVIG
jgi:retron-type reverse transcriptase